MRYGVVAVLMVFALSCDGESENEGETLVERCSRMRDHLVELRLDPIAPRSVPGARVPAERAATITASIREQHRSSLIAALGDDFAERCAQTMTRSQIDCILAAPDSQAAVVCTR